MSIFRVFRQAVEASKVNYNIQVSECVRVRVRVRVRVCGCMHTCMYQCLKLGFFWGGEWPCSVLNQPR